MRCKNNNLYPNQVGLKDNLKVTSMGKGNNLKVTSMGKGNNIKVINNTLVFINDCLKDNIIYSLIRNPNEDRMNNLPLNSDGLTFLNKFESDENIVSINGGCMSKNIIPECSLGGNNLLLMKCLSNVKITLDSDFAILESSLSLEFKEIFIISKPFSLIIP